MSECLFCLAVEVDGEKPHYRDDIGDYICCTCERILEEVAPMVECSEDPGKEHPLKNGEVSFSGPMLDRGQMGSEDAEKYKDAVSDFFSFVGTHSELAKKYSDVETDEVADE